MQGRSADGDAIALTSYAKLVKAEGALARFIQLRKSLAGENRKLNWIRARMTGRRRAIVVPLCVIVPNGRREVALWLGCSKYLASTSYISEGLDRARQTAQSITNHVSSTLYTVIKL